MKYMVELRATRDIPVHAGSYWEAAILTEGSALPDSAVREEYCRQEILRSGRRAVSFGNGRKLVIPHIHSLTFQLATNIITDRHLLADSLALALSRDGTTWQEIACNSARISIQTVAGGFALVVTRN